MRTTISIDDDLLADASAALGVSERTAVLHEGLRAVIQREAARRLARLGGSDAKAALPVRKRAAVVAAAPPAAKRKR